MKKEILITMHIKDATIRGDISELMADIAYDIGRDNTKDFYELKKVSASVETREIE